MDEIGSILARMETGDAAQALARAARELFRVLGEEERRHFIEQMLGEPGEDKIVGMVHL